MQNVSLSPPPWIETLARFQQDPTYTVRQLRNDVLCQCRAIIEEAGLDWDDFRNRKTPLVAQVKANVCYYAHQCMKDWDEEKALADMLGITLSGFKAARYRGRDLYGTRTAR